MYQEKIIDIETGKITMRDYSLEEIAEVDAAINRANETKQMQDEFLAKKQAAKAKLEMLGLTDDDLKALGL